MSVQITDEASPSPQRDLSHQMSRKMSRKQTLRAMQPPDIFAACRQGDIAALRTALCNGLDPNSRSMGQTPLMYACEKGHHECAQLLISNGANISLVDSYNRTALHMACKSNHVECAEVLMGAGAAIDVESTLGGETPADIVHARGSIEMVRTVMYFGKSPKKIKDATQRPAGEIAPQPVAEKSNTESAVTAAPVTATATEEFNEASLPAALSYPRRPPPPEIDELKRLHTPPRREPA